MPEDRPPSRVAVNVTVLGTGVEPPATQTQPSTCTLSGMVPIGGRTAFCIPGDVFEEDAVAACRLKRSTGPSSFNRGESRRSSCNCFVESAPTGCEYLSDAVKTFC